MNPQPISHVILFDPLLLTPLTCLLALYPFMRLYQRVGLSRWWALLVFLSLLVPFAGFAAALLPLAVKAWPRFPAPSKKEKPVKLPL